MSKRAKTTNVRAAEVDTSDASEVRPTGDPANRRAKNLVVPKGVHLPSVTFSTDEHERQAMFEHMLLKEAWDDGEPSAVWKIQEDM